MIMSKQVPFDKINARGYLFRREMKESMANIFNSLVTTFKQANPIN